jgi:hypothetical protein
MLKGKAIKEACEAEERVWKVLDYSSLGMTGSCFVYDAQKAVRVTTEQYFVVSLVPSTTFQKSVTVLSHDARRLRMRAVFAVSSARLMREIKYLPRYDAFVTNFAVMRIYLLHLEEKQETQVEK